MKTTFEATAHAGFIELSQQDMVDINGGGFWGDLAYAAGYAAHVVVALIAENIEHPIGVAGGYPPK